MSVAAWRRRDRHLVDIVLFLATLTVWSFASPPMPVGAVVGDLVRVLLTICAVLVVRHFRSVQVRHSVLWWLPPLAVLSCVALWALQPFSTTRGALPAYLAIGMIAIAATMIVEAGRSRGVHAKRMVMAAIGTGCLALSFAGASVLRFIPLPPVLVATLPQESFNAALVCYFVAFSTPRWLTSRWRRTEQAAYFAQIAEREPEERGWLAAEDLLNGVDRCIGGALVLVARRHPRGSGGMVISAASDRTLVGVGLEPGDGLLGHVILTGTADAGAVVACEPDVASVLARYGSFVLVAPIVASGSFWGLVAVVHRRGALFPEEDLSMLAQLGRSAATAFDHAALIVERREQVRLASDSRLREIESRVGLMLDSIKDYAMLVLDEEGIIAAWHTGAQHVFGHTREQVTHASGAALFGMTHFAFAAWLAEANLCGVAEREGTCCRPDGSSFNGQTIIRPLIAEPGAPRGFVVVTLDVTERRELEDRLRQGEKMQAIGQLAGGVAHDFNNLLTAILGYSDWLERDMAGDPRVDQIREIQRAADRGAALTRQLLAFSRGRGVRRSSLDVATLVQGLLPMLLRLIGSNITIVDATSPLASPVMGDRGQIEQVVLNLVLNARDAMPEGGRITIRAFDAPGQQGTTSASRSGHHVLLEVADTGIGMDPETQRRAFEPFFTTKEVGSGTGLGLATVHGIVQQMGGWIETDSAPGRGTTFRLFLPQAVASAATGDVPEILVPIRRSETLLLIEDDDALRVGLVQVLEGHGYRVIAVAGAEAALTVTDAEVHALDLVISDVLMPGMSGPEVVAELLEIRPSLRTLFITGQSDAVSELEGGMLASGPLLQKPFSPLDLLTKVRELLSVA